MKKENHWSQFATNFEERNNYVVGVDDMSVMLKKMGEVTNLGKTLELGCGNGTYSKVIAKNSATLISTDFSEQMVHIATERLKAFDNITVEKADCFRLHYSENSFDSVFMANLLHVVSEPEKAIAQTGKVLKKSGRIIVLDFGTEGMTFFNKLRLFYRYNKTYGKPSKNRQSLTLEKISRMLIDNGFEINESSLIGEKMKASFVIATKMSAN